MFLIHTQKQHTLSISKQWWRNHHFRSHHRKNAIDNNSIATHLPMLAYQNIRTNTTQYNRAVVTQFRSCKCANDSSSNNNNNQISVTNEFAFLSLFLTSLHSFFLPSSWCACVGICIVVVQNVTRRNVWTSVHTRQNTVASFIAHSRRSENAAKKNERRMILLCTQF